MVSFTPSAIEDEVYNICEQIDYLVSSKEYTIFTFEFGISQAPF